MIVEDPLKEEELDWEALAKIVCEDKVLNEALEELCEEELADEAPKEDKELLGEALKELSKLDETGWLVTETLREIEKLSEAEELPEKPPNEVEELCKGEELLEEVLGEELTTDALDTDEEGIGELDVTEDNVDKRLELDTALVYEVAGLVEELENTLLDS